MFWKRRKELEKKFKSLEIATVGSGYDYDSNSVFGFNFGWSLRKKVSDVGSRVSGIERKLDMLIEHLGLEEVFQEEKTYLKKKTTKKK